MKTIITLLSLVVALTLISCRQQEQTTASDLASKTAIDSVTLADLAPSWIQLTEKDGKQVIYLPCDANNTEIGIRHDTLYINWGQEEEFYNILSLDQHSTRLALKVNPDYDENEIRNFRFEFLDEDKKKARWYLWQDSTSAVFIDSRIKDQYQEIKQPCLECWGEDVCDEAAKRDSTASGS
ncbi:MAG: hypothetical protein ACOYXT_30255 [Bacteroidota bacterium]